ncbi:hypothetical protein KKG05_06945 [bacterium]|nr:hypothetical protein [bacterium]
MFYIQIFLAVIVAFSSLQAAELSAVAEECGFGEEINQVHVTGAIQAVAPFQNKNIAGAYIISTAVDGSLELTRWSEADGIEWRRNLEYPVFISLSVSAQGELVAACTWEEESVLGFIFDEAGEVQERMPLGSLAQLQVYPDGGDWSVAWAQFDWHSAHRPKIPIVKLAPSCFGDHWNRKPVQQHRTIWWYRPEHHPSEQDTSCYPAFAMTDRYYRTRFFEQEGASFVTFFADVIAGDNQCVLVKEGEDVERRQVRKMLALDYDGKELWRVEGFRQSSQVSGYVDERDFVLFFAGEDIEYRSAEDGHLIASDAVYIPQRERLFPIQNVIASVDGLLILGRQLSAHITLLPGEGILDCRSLDIGGAISYDKKIGAFFEVSPGALEQTCFIYRRTK